LYVSTYSSDRLFLTIRFLQQTFIFAGIQERLDGLAATCAARKRLPLRNEEYKRIQPVTILINCTEKEFSAGNLSE